jgi:hypothetical protein
MHGAEKPGISQQSMFYNEYLSFIPVAALIFSALALELFP